MWYLLSPKLLKFKKKNYIKSVNCTVGCGDANMTVPIMEIFFYTSENNIQYF